MSALSLSYSHDTYLQRFMQMIALVQCGHSTSWDHRAFGTLTLFEKEKRDWVTGLGSSGAVPILPLGFDGSRGDWERRSSSFSPRSLVVSLPGLFPSSHPHSSWSPSRPCLGSPTLSSS